MNARGALVAGLMAAVTLTCPVAAAPAPPNCPVPEQVFVHIDAVQPFALTASPAQVLCDPGTLNDVEYVTVGAPQPFAVSPVARVRLMRPGEDPSEVTVDWGQFTAGDVGAFGGYYGLNLAGPVVTEIHQYYHP